MGELILTEQNDAGIGIVTINRPRVRNALNREAMIEFVEAVQWLAQNDNLCAVIIRGAGYRAFSSGGDIREMHADTATDDKPGSITIRCHRRWMCWQPCRSL